MKVACQSRGGFALLLAALWVYLALGSALVGAVPLSQVATPTPTIPPLSLPGANIPSGTELSDLAAAAQAENLEWQNITFWAQGVLGDPRLSNLAIGLHIGQEFFNLQVLLLSGSTLAVADLSGPVLMNFWASWCEPCRQERPLLIEAHADEAAPFQIVLTNVWDEIEAYERFAAAEFPPTLATGRGSADLPDRLGLRAIPVSILLGADHRIVAVHVGNLTPAVMASLYALAGPEPAPGALTTPVAAATGVSPSLLELAAAAGRANRRENAVTIWAGGLLGQDSGMRVGVRVGEKLPSFALATTQGEVFRLDVAGEPYLVNFWASWCGPCITEFPLLVAYHQQPGASFRIAFVNVWDDPYTYRQFLMDRPADILAMMDERGALPDMYGFDFIPVSVLVDAQGIVRLIQLGPVNEALLEFASALLAAS